ncbi:MAG: HAD family hydrolase [Christensenellaceae bacterium]|nr:HAD family hydrolase [Christensenellaceae bacterium]
MLKNADAILFDLDGTLWDSSEGIVLAWNSYLAAHPELGVAPNITLEKMQSVIGLEIEKLAAGLFPSLSPEKRMEVTDLCYLEEVAYLAAHGAPLCPGVARALPLLAEKRPLAIVSNCQAGYIEAFLDSMGMRGLFADFECSGYTGMSKDKNIALLAERNGYKNPVYVGDTATDCRAAALAGVPFIFASYGFGSLPAEEQHALAIASAMELVDML